MKSLVSRYTDQTLSRARAKLREHVNDLRDEADLILRDLERYGSTTHVGCLLNLLRYIQEENAKVEALGEVEKLAQADEKADVNPEQSKEPA